MSYIQADGNGIKTVTGSNWRLVHNGISVMELAEQNFTATTGGNAEIFVADTKAECDAEIARLGLAIPAHIVDRYK